MNIDERLKDSAPRLRDAVDQFALPETVPAGPRPKRWRIATTVAAAAVICIAIIAISRVQESPETWTVHEDQANGLSMQVAPGWSLSSGPLRPWLASPHELLSAATVPLTPSPRSGNQAACPSEVAQVVVDQIGRNGGYFSLDEGFTGGPRPDHAVDLAWRPGCSLPQGMTVELATFTDAQRDFVVTVVFGPDASQALRDDLYAMLDSLEVRCTSRPVC